MKPTNFIHAARAKKQAEVIRSLEQTFTDFAYPVYLFGSFANGNFHGYSDIDLVILVSKQQAKQAYNEACDKLTGLKTPYDILTCQSVDELDHTIQSTLHPINNPQRSLSIRKHQQGMTLVEIMISLLIGAFLLGGVLQIFINSKQTYRMQDAVSRLQENGRFALEFLTHEIRMAGHIGCASVNPASVTNDLNTASGDYNVFIDELFPAIQGFEAVGAAWAPAINAAVTLPLPGSDVITIRRAGDQSFPVTAHLTGAADLTLDPAIATADNLRNAGFLNAAGNNLCARAIVNNCQRITVFQISGIAANVLSHAAGVCAPGPGNASNNLGNITYVGGEVFPARTVSYYVRNNPANQPALYRRVNRDNAEELVESIEQLQITYGVDTTGAYRYVTANNVANWANVVSVRIVVTARTLEANLSAAGDGRLRQDFSTTIALRNRLP